tara:strand:- start:2473 stop:4107 length:1635 start_codon:yes stop_codon:yes gene_type:complete
MASYYKYAEKKVENEVNWGAISKGITDSLTAEADSRVQRKAAIDQASNDDITKLMDKPQGEYVNENGRISDYAEQAQKTQLASLRLLKSGAITEQEYNFRTNNLRTGTDMAFNLSGQYQEQYGRHMDDIRSGKASGAQAQLLAKMEQFGNPKDSKYYVNPLSGEVSLALTKGGKGKQIKIGDSSFDLVSLNTAKNIINQTIDRYDSDANTSSIAEGIGKRIQTLIGTTDKRGYLVTEENAYEALMKDGGKALQDQINSSFAGDPNGKMSFLIDTLKTDGGEAYTLVYDKKDKGGANILMVPNDQGTMVPELTDEQEGLVMEGMLGLVKNKLDQTQKLKGDSRVMTDYQEDYLDVMKSRGASKEEIDEYVAYNSRYNQTFDEEGQAAVTKGTVKGLPEDAFSLDERISTKETILNVFDKNPAFKNVNINEVQIDFEDESEEKEMISQVDKGGNVLQVPGGPLKSESIKIFIPSIMEEAISIPSSADQNIMSEVISRIDQLNKQGVPITLESLKSVFEDDDLFYQYNKKPSEDDKEGSNKKKLPGT